MSPSLRRVLPLVEVEVPESLRRVLRERHLVVVVDDPPALAQDVADVVADVHRAPHVRDERAQLVPGLAVAQVVRGGAGGGSGGRGGRRRGGGGVLATVVVRVAESSIRKSLRSNGL